jgi:hypothetical protein
MNTSIYKITLFFVVLFFLSDMVRAAGGRVITDRDIYISGEEVLTDVFVPDNCLFKVVYLSLTNSSGSIIQIANLPMHDFRAAGHLYLPDSLPSGSYLITAYSPQEKCPALESKEILVLNRFEDTDEPIGTERGDLPAIPALPVSAWHVTGLKENYRQGDAVELSLNNEKRKGSLLAVSVGRCFPGWEPRHWLNPVEKNGNIRQMGNEGVVLQGVVRRLTGGEPVAGAMVYLSISDSIPYFDYCRTQDDGRFRFLLSNRYGLNKLVLQAEKEGETTDLQLVPELLRGMDNRGFAVSTLPIDQELRNYLTESIQLVTFRKIYQMPDLVVQTFQKKPAFPFPFYGQSAMKTKLDEYFEMSDFNEISKELLQAVRFRNRNGEYHMNVVDYDFRTYLDDNPMVLIDGVPLRDLSRLAPMGSKDIKRIDVVPYQRFYGDLRMDGVVAVYTKSGDASAVPVSEHLLKLNFEALQTDVELPGSGKKAASEPDFRQLLYWNPAFNPTSDGTIRFVTPNVNGTYRVYLLERTDDGQLLERTEYFTVSNTL